jgi:hypothetical protein
MENTGTIKVKVENKTRKRGKIGIRTVEGDAKENEDFLKINEILEFDDETDRQEVEVTILNSRELEPDE